MKIECAPLSAQRIGKKLHNKSRLILVKLDSAKEKINVLRAAKALKGSPIFIMEDLSREERKYRQKLVNEMKRERRGGNKAFIRFRDNKLIVNGEERSLNSGSMDDTITE